MSTEAARVMPMPAGTAAVGETKRRRKRGEAERASDGSLVLKEKFPNEGGAMVEALKRDVPYYRVEVWRSRAIVKEGSVEIKKEAVSARA